LRFCIKKLSVSIIMLRGASDQHVSHLKRHATAAASG
jgi:hypothetical protein